jgi:hypothetical protein
MVELFELPELLGILLLVPVAVVLLSVSISEAHQAEPGSTAHEIMHTGRSPHLP